MNCFKSLSVLCLLSTLQYASFGQATNVNPGAINEFSRQQQQQQDNINKLDKQRQYLDLNKSKKSKTVNNNKNLSRERLHISEITVSGHELISDSAISKVLDKYNIHELSSGDLQNIVNDLNALYQNQGYITSFFYLPKQNIRKGVLELKAIEGKQKINFVAKNKYFSKRAMEPFSELRDSDNLNINDISKTVNRLNQNPDLNVGLKFSKGDRPNETIVNLIADSKRPYHFSLTADNLGRDSIGENRLGATFTHNNLLGFGDQSLSQVSFNPDFSLNLSQNYEIPINDRGTRLGMSYNKGQLAINGIDSLSEFDIKGRSTTYSPYIKQALFSNKEWDISTQLNFQQKFSKTDYEGINLQNFNRTRLSVLNPNLNILKRHKNGTSVLNTGASLGLDTLGANTSGGILNRQGANEEFAKFTANFTHVHSLPKGLRSISKVSGQYSLSDLTSLEQYQTGGAFNIRGYKEGNLTGDNGFTMSQEIQVPAFIFPKNMGFNITDNGYPSIFSIKKHDVSGRYIFRDNIKFVGFADAGGVFTRGDSTLDQMALGVGGGIRVNLTNHLTARFDVGVPLVNWAARSTDNMSFHFGVTARPF